MLDRHTPHRPASTEPFDRLTRLAAHLFDAPMAALVYADAGPATVVASTGFEAASSSCNDGLFLHAADQNAITVVNDVVCHPGFADSPLVTEAPCVRFYAGAPLRQEDGRVIGALCVMDVAPSSTPPGAGERLGDLAALAAREVEATRPRLLRPPAESEREFRDLLHALDDVAAWTIDFAPDRSLDALLDVPLAASLHRVRYANDAVEAVYGYPREDFVQRPSLWVESVDAVEQAHIARVRAAWTVSRSLAAHPRPAPLNPHVLPLPDHDKPCLPFWSLKTNHLSARTWPRCSKPPSTTSSWLLTV